MIPWPVRVGEFLYRLATRKPFASSPSWQVGTSSLDRNGNNCDICVTIVFVVFPFLAKSVFLCVSEVIISKSSCCVERLFVSLQRPRAARPWGRVHTNGRLAILSYSGIWTIPRYKDNGQERPHLRGIRVSRRIVWESYIIGCGHCLLISVRQSRASE